LYESVGFKRQTSKPEFDVYFVEFDAIEII
jgi:hypothetical protein